MNLTVFLSQPFLDCMSPEGKEFMEIIYLEMRFQRFLTIRVFSSYDSLCMSLSSEGGNFSPEQVHKIYTYM